MLPSSESHIYFETLFNHAKQNAVLLIETDGTIRAVNSAFTDHFGYSNSEIVNRNLAVLFTAEDQGKDLPQRELLTVLETGCSSDNNYLVHKNKNVTWVSGESLLIKTKKDKPTILKVIQNIHAQKVLESDLLSLNDFNENILGSIENAIVILNHKLEVIKANHAFDKLFRIKDHTSGSINFAELIKSSDNNNFLLNSIRHVIETKKSSTHEQLEIITASDDRKIFDISCSVVKNTQHDNLLLIMHDITMLKQIEKEREDLIGFIAHELRNPLTNLVLCNEIMGIALKTENIEQVKEMLERSRNNVRRLNKMIADLYDTTKVSSGNLQLDTSSFNFADVIKEAIENIMTLQPSYRITAEGNTAIQIKADRYRLIQVIMNYLSNGIKYSNGKNEIIISVKKESHFLIVSVKDEGLGISKEQLPYIFDRFFRTEKSRTVEGLGLGLYLCRRIIHAHKGQVWAESEEGKGSTFYFSIPINI